MKIRTILSLFRINLSASSPTSGADTTTRFKFLDGFRGSLAIVVILAHASKNPATLITKCEIIHILATGDQRYSMSGFFVLSAFLLTHRLLGEFERADRLTDLILITLKYLTRRFFRIYVVFLLAMFMSKYGPRFVTGYFYGSFGSLYNAMFLDHIGYNHLWSIPPEIKYYFCIPLFCLIVRFCNKKYSIGFLLFWMLWTLYDQAYNIFELSADDVQVGGTYHYLNRHFAVFILGSQVALAFYLVQQLAPNYEQFIADRPIVRLLFDILSIVIGLVGVRTQFEHFNSHVSHTFRSRSAVYWSVTMFICLLSAPANKVTRFFATSDILCTCGKYSFGMYLFNSGSISFIYDNFKFGTEVEYTMACVLFACVVGFVWFYVVENPLMNLANLICKRIDSLIKARPRENFVRHDFHDSLEKQVQCFEISLYRYLKYLRIYRRIN